MARVVIKGAALKRKQRALIDATEPKIARAFLRDIHAVCNDALMNSLVEAIEQRDMDGVLAVLNLDESVFDEYRASMQEAFRQGGNLTVQALPALRKLDAS